MLLCSTVEADEAIVSTGLNNVSAGSGTVTVTVVAGFIPEDAAAAGSPGILSHSALVEHLQPSSILTTRSTPLTK
jgi:hypothetical protein